MWPSIAGASMLLGSMVARQTQRCTSAAGLKGGGRGKLLAWMAKARRRALEKENARVVTVAIGNEAGDLDSIVSPIACAYLIDKFGLPDGTRAHAVIPVISFPRSQFRLRRDAETLFHKVFGEKAPLADLCFLDDAIHPANLVLTDHNALTITEESYANAPVLAILDHHTDSGDHREAQGTNRVVRDDVGSACTIVTQALLKDPSAKIPEELAFMLLAVIELDCRRWNPSKTSPIDREIYAKLIEQLSLSWAELTSGIYEELSEARRDVSGFSFADLLRLDYKNCSCIRSDAPKVGMASIGANFFDLSSSRGSEVDRMQEMRENMLSFAKERGLDAIVALTAPCNGQRHLMLTGESEQVVLDIVTLLQAPPSAFPKEISALGILAKQGISEKGFAGKPVEATGIKVLAIDAQISRKSIKPSIEAWI